MSDSDSSAGPTLESRVESRRAQRSARAERDMPGAASFPERMHRWAEQVQARMDRRLEAGEVPEEASSGLAKFRPIRYFSGPWNGTADDLLPVSWFLLWRSNVNWTPGQVFLRRDETKRGLPGPGTGCLEPFQRPRRPLPRDFALRPARQRTRPQEFAALRVKPQPTTED